MRYRFYVNVQQDARGHFVGFGGYQPEHALRLAYDGAVDAGDDPHACEYLFGQFNLNHPDDYRNRSMSVGDVVVLLDDNLQNGRAFACAPYGFSAIDMPEPLVRKD